VSKARMLIAAGFATVFAPVLLALNYLVASHGDALLSRWLSPSAGVVFFAAYAISAVAAIGLCYGSLPLLIGAARNTLSVRNPGGGLAT
jgi:hypothetical protein